MEYTRVRLTKQQLIDADKCGIYDEFDCYNCSCNIDGLGCQSSERAAYTALELQKEKDDLVEHHEKTIESLREGIRETKDKEINKLKEQNYELMQTNKDLINLLKTIEENAWIMEESLPGDLLEKIKLAIEEYEEAQ